MNDHSIELLLIIYKLSPLGSDQKIRFKYNYVLSDNINIKKIFEFDYL